VATGKIVNHLSQELAEALMALSSLSHSISTFLPNFHLRPSPYRSAAGGGLNMSLLEAVNVLVFEAAKRLDASEDGFEQMDTLERLLELLP
jgi:hypothetical protein